MMNKTETDLIEMNRRIYLKTRNPSFIMLEAYDRLLQSEEIESVDEHDDKLLQSVIGRLRAQATREGTRSLKDFAASLNSEAYKKTVLNECKRQVVANYFELEYNIENF